MDHTTMAEDYPLPATMDGVRERIAELTGDCALIGAQLQDHDRRASMTPAEYRIWRSKAVMAQAHKVREKQFLRTHMARMEDERQAAAKQARAARIARAEAEQVQKVAALARASDEVQLVVRLQTALGRLYRISGAPMTEVDEETMTLARAYLVEAGVYPERELPRGGA